ncbi:MAG: DUF898 family protein [Salinarimonas sp.]
MLSARAPVSPVPMTRIQAMTAPPGCRVSEAGAVGSAGTSDHPALPPMPVATRSVQARPATPDMQETSAKAGGGHGSETIAFTGRRGAFAGLLARGSLLTLPTLGLYRFWLITDIRRHLWGNTVIAGEPLEYAGRGGELLRGFLIGMAVLIPLNLLLTLLGLTSFGNSVSLAGPTFFGLMVLQQFAQFRTFAYRITRSRYRGIAGSLDAQFAGYFMRRIGWDSVAILSLGLAIPFRRASLDRYLIGGCRIGDQKAQFTGSGWSLAWRVYLGWMITVLVWAAIYLTLGPLVPPFFSGGSPELRQLGEILAGATFSIIAAIIVGFTLYTVYVAIWQRWRLAHLSFGETRFASALPVRRVIFCYLRFGAGALLLLFLITVLLGMVALFLTQHFPEETRALFGTSEEPSTFSAVLSVAGILVGLTLIGAMRRYFIERGVWVAVMSTLTVTQPQALIERLRYCEPTSAGAGEGLADAFALGP